MSFEALENYLYHTSVDEDIAIESLRSKMMNNTYGYSIPDFKKGQEASKILNKIIPQGQPDGICIHTVTINKTIVNIWVLYRCPGAMTIFGAIRGITNNPEFERENNVRFIDGQCAICLPISYFENTANEEFYKFAMYHEYGHVEHADIKAKRSIKSILYNKSKTYINKFIWALRYESNDEMAADIFSINSLNLSKDEYNKFMDRLLAEVTEGYKTLPNADKLIHRADQILRFRRNIVLHNWDKYVTTSV